MTEETRGWKVSKRKVMYKEINGEHYELREAEPGGLWYVQIAQKMVPAYSLRNAKLAAHRFAEGRE